ncbi:MAG: hypothetical protein ABI830_04610 [Pseudolabrys sp.]
MSGLLYGVGAFAVMVGVVMIGFGIPVGEFSFGNTLIVAGTVSLVGGLIVGALGVVVAQMQRLTDVMSNRAPMRAGRPADMFESAPAARTPLPGRPRMPAKPEPEFRVSEADPFMPHDNPHNIPQNIQQAPVEAAQAPNFAPNFAPTLRNPDETPVTVEDDVSLSPMQPAAAPAPAAADFAAPASGRDFGGTGMGETRYERTPEQGWRPSPPPVASPKAPQTTYFDAMWPAPSKPSRGPAAGADKPVDREPERTPAVPAMSDAPAVAILKSGMVDGMAYTLYVDGSIEAELPQGTLRFASINELRSHLENNA